MSTITNDTSVRPTAVVDFAPGSVARGQNFFVQWLQGEGSVTEARSEHEMLLLLPDGGTDIAIGQEAPRFVPGGSVCIVPAGSVVVHAPREGRAVLVASSRPDLAPGSALNDGDYATRDARLAPSDAGYRRKPDRAGLQVIAIADIQAPQDKPRLKMLQTETLSINWVDYEGARDRSKLSPHSHADFEQGSLAIDGHFIHHLRVQWGADANQWRADEHLAAGPASMIAIPAQMLHTTEGVGEGRHLLIDVFSPPREDFIGKGWVANTDDYVREPR